MSEFQKNIVTADALHTQRKTCEMIRKGKGDYVLPVKENQALLLKEIKARFEKHSDQVTTMKTEKRVFDFYLLPKHYAVDGFTGMKQFVRMISSVRKKPVEMYFITSLKDPDDTTDAIESRWEIENELHREKDAYFSEDAIRYTDRNAVQSMVLLNNLGLTVIRLYQAVAKLESLTYAKLYVKADPIAALNLLLGTLNSEEIMKQVKSEIRKRTRK